MTDDRLDLVVIGAGSGGVRAARFAAQLGARVAVVEAAEFGGTCVHRGCVPKKLLVYGSEYATAFADARGFGWDVEVRGHSWAALRDAKDRELLRLDGIYRRLLEDANVQIIEGRGTLAGPNTVRVGERTLVADRILVATGGRALRPEIPGTDLGFTSDEAFHLPEIPRSVAILGAGYIALEFAGIFHGLGAEVHVVHRGDVVLRRFDADVRTHLAAEMQKRGIHFHFGATVTGIERGSDPAGRALRLGVANGESLAVDAVMHAIGRAPNSANLGLEALGVVLQPGGAIEVDAEYQTQVPSILAIGDVTDRVQLTPVALAEGTWVARKYFGKQSPPPIAYDLIPSAVFTQPNVGTVGLTEEDARRSHDVAVYRSTFKPMRHTLSGRDERTMMKLVVDRGSDRVLGVHVVGPDAGEIVQGFAVALSCGATKSDLDATIGIHPTAAEELVTMRTPVA